MVYEIIQASKHQQEVLGKSRVLTPVRKSLRINSRSDSHSQKKSTRNHTSKDKSLSVRFIDELDDCAIISTSAEKLIPLDESAARIRKHIQERQPTPYSKSHAKRQSPSSGESSSNENDLDMGFLVDPTKSITFGFEKSNGSKGEEFFEGNGLRKANSKKSKAGAKQEDSHGLESPEFTVDFDTVINPNIGGNGNYAIVKLTETSAKKIGTDKAITPLKRLKREDQDSACRDFQSVPFCLEEDIAFIPYNEEVVKNLQSKCN